MLDNTEINKLKSKLEKLNPKLEKLSKQLQSPDLTKNREKYVEVSQEFSDLNDRKNLTEKLLKLDKQFKENEELLLSEADSEMKSYIEGENSEIQKNLSEFQKNLEEIENPDHPVDKGNAIIEIRAGAGGEEAALFAQELFRAYIKYAKNKSFRAEIASTSYSSVGGFKEAVFFVEGEFAYKTFKYEGGVHRVQRVPETESSGRIHTSTVSVVVLPETPKVKVNINQQDLRIDVYRASGPGGQSVNTTDSAVRIVHEPTGITVTCQDQKSQHKNKDKAMKILQAKLQEIARQEQEEKLSETRQSAIKNGDRSDKIRTYNFPQSRITDHRIKQSWHNIDEVMEGNFDEITDQLQKELS